MAKDRWEERFQAWKEEKKRKEERVKNAEEQRMKGELTKTLERMEKKDKEKEIEIVDISDKKVSKEIDRRLRVVLFVLIVAVIVFVGLIYKNNIINFFKGLF